MADKYLVSGTTPGGGINAASITDAGAVGREVLQSASEEDVRAVIAPRYVDPMDGVVWTIVPDTGVTAAFAAGKLTMAAATTISGVLVSATSPSIVPNFEAYDFLLRVQVTNGDAAAGSSVQFVFRVGIDASNYLSTTLRSDGAMEVRSQRGATSDTLLSMTAIPDIDSTARTAGQLWLRVSRRLGRIIVLWGLGSGGALPVRWSEVYNSPDTVAANALWSSQGGYITLILFPVGGVTGGYDLDVLAIRATGQAAGAF